MGRARKGGLRVALILAVGLGPISHAAAQAPANDECSGAAVIPSLPFNASQDTRLATPNAGDPVLVCADGGGGNTVWFVYTATSTQVVTFSTVGSSPRDYDVAMGLFTGTCGALTLVACNDDVSAGVIRQSEITHILQPGTTYYVHVAEWAGGGPDGGFPTGGDLVFTARPGELPPPVKGSKTGTIAAGAVVSTDPYGPESPFFSRTIIPPRINQPRSYLPDPPTPIPPAAPAGANYIESRSEKLARASSQPLVMKSFEGIPDQGIRIPPDPDLAVGPNHVIAVANSRFRIYDKAGAIQRTIEAGQWHDPVTSSGEAIFDPQVIFDHHAGRWVMTWLQTVDTSSAAVFVSVSDDADPLGTWYVWATPSNALGDSATGLFDDYPQLGYDAEAVYFTGRMFTLSGSTYAYSRLRIFPKSSLYSSQGGAISWFDMWDFRDPTDLLVAPDGLQVANVFGKPGVQFLITDSQYQTGTYFSVWTITNPATTPAVTASHVPVTAFTTPPNAGQLGGGTLPVEAGGRRLRSNPVYRDSSLWAVHTVASGSAAQYSAIRYVRINPFTGALLEDAAVGAEGYWHYYAALTVDQNKDVLITFSRSGVTEYIGAFVAGRKEGDPPGLSPAVPVKVGEGNYVKDFGWARNRWGDYNGIALDPADEGAVWIQTEYAAAGNRWGNWVAMARLTPLPGAYAYIPDESMTLAFPASETGSASPPDTLVLKNVGSDPLVISSVVPPGPDFTYAGAPITAPIQVPSFGEARFPFRFTPTRAGDILDSVVFASNATNAPSLTIAMQGRGVEVSPAVLGTMFAAAGPSPSRLLTVNTAGGSASEVGTITTAEIHGLSVQPSTGKLYGTSASSLETTLYRISSSSGEAVPAARVPVGNMRALAFSRDDTLYGATTGGDLYRVDPATGDAAFVGTAPGIAYSSLSFDPISGALLASVRPALGLAKDHIYRVDTGTGDTALAGRTTLGLVTPGIAFDSTGNLYAVIGTGTVQSQLYQLDRQTGVATLIGATGQTGINAIAIKTDSLAEPPPEVLPGRYELSQNYPNPFNPATTIRFGLPFVSQVRLTLYDMLGREVTRLVDGVLPAGSHESLWNGRTREGSGAATGIYLYKLQATRLDGSAAGSSNAFVETRKMVLMK